MQKVFFSFLLSISVCSFLSAQRSYASIDAGSKIHFVIKNFGIKTGGDFSGLKGTIKFDAAKLAASSFNVSVDAKTVNTDNNTRDGHLRKSEYFDVDKFPLISFVSTKITESTTAGRFYVFGNLTIKAVSKPIEFGFSATAKGKGYFFEGSFEINRRDFGVGGKSISMADKLAVSLSVLAN